MNISESSSCKTQDFDWTEFKARNEQLMDMIALYEEFGDDINLFL